MKRLRLASTAAIAGVAAAIASAEAAAAQERWSEEYAAPRTVWGHPDLQGSWTNATLTPLERPAGEGPVLSDEAAAAIEREREERYLASLQPSDPNRPAPPVGGDGNTNSAGGGTGGYNSVYIDRGDQMAVVNGEYRTSLITVPSDGHVPDLTPEGRRLQAEYRQWRSRFGQYDNPENRPLGERCIISFGSNAGPPMLPNGFYNNNYTIVQTEDHVLINIEMVHDTRIIRLGERKPLPEHIRPWFGDSWGHWEGDTLVVETTNIHSLQRFQGNPSDNLKVIERFHRADDDTILYRFTVEDPTVYTQTWGGEVPMEKMPEGEFLYEYACHEGNYALFNILSGARAQERNGEGADQTSTDQQQ